MYERLTALQNPRGVLPPDVAHAKAAGDPDEDPAVAFVRGWLRFGPGGRSPADLGPRHTLAVTNVEPPDPLRYARRWARVVIWQIGRVREVHDVRPAHRVGDRPGFFDRLGAEQHFLLVAATQLSRSLSALEGEGLALVHQTELTLLRNVREHWDEWQIDKRSPAQFRQAWPAKSPWTITASDGDLSLAGLVPLRSLEASARALLAELDAADARRGET